MHAPVIAPVARIDLAGALVAGLCAMHCAILPFALGSLGAAGLGWIASERIGQAVLLLSTVFIAASLVPAVRRHRNLLPLGLVLLAVAAFAVAELGAYSRSATAVWSALGGGLVALAHLRNRSLLRAR